MYVRKASLGMQVDIQLMNLEQAYEMGPELLSSARRPPFSRCIKQIYELPAT